MRAVRTLKAHVRIGGHHPTVGGDMADGVTVETPTMRETPPGAYPAPEDDDLEDASFS